MSLENPVENLSKDLKQLSETEVVGTERVGGALQTRETKITLPEIAELEEPTKKIIEQLRSRIENGEYGLIIGEDVSGRIPALILGRFIKRIYRLRGVRVPEIIFIPGKLDEEYDYKETLKKYVFKYGAREGDRILIVTEAIDTGQSLKVLSKLLAECGFTIDIATIGIIKSEISIAVFADAPFFGESH